MGTRTKQLLWFGGIWLAGLATVTIVALAIRFVLKS